MSKIIKILTTINIYIFRPILFISLIAASAAATNPDEYDKNREELASKYTALNKNIEMQSLRWNQLMAIRAASIGIHASENILADCLESSSNFRINSSACDDPRQAYKNALEKMKSVIDANLKNGNDLPEAVELADISRRLTQLIAEIKETKRVTLGRGKNSICRDHRRRSLPKIFERFKAQLKSGNVRNAIITANDARAQYNSANNIAWICDDFSNDGPHLNRQIQSSIATQLVLIEFVEARLDGGFVGTKICVRFDKGKPKIRQSKNYVSFSTVCTALVNDRAINNFQTDNRWLRSLLDAIEDAHCKTAILDKFTSGLRELDQIRYTGASLPVDGCQVAEPSWRNLKAADAQHIRSLVSTAVTLAY